MSHILITGATSGIGAAVVERACAGGHVVTALGRRVDRIAQLAQQYGDRSVACCADVTDQDSLTAAIACGCERFGTIDVIVANAGRGCDGELLACSADDLRSVFDVNVIGIHQTIAASRPQWSPQARVVLVASILSGFALPRMGAYSATKFAVDAYAAALRMEVADDGYYVTSVHPGTVATEFFDVATQAGQTWTWRPGKPLQPQRVAQVILRAGLGPKRRRWWIPRRARLAVLVARLFPSVFEWLLRRKLSDMP